MMPVAQTSTFALGIYTIRQQPLFDNRALAIFLIFMRDKLIGRQISYPCLTDCEWHRYQHGQYATAEESRPDMSTRRRAMPFRRYKIKFGKGH